MSALYVLPTVKELATLAALLQRNRAGRKMSAHDALRLWQDCQLALDDERLRLNKLRDSDARSEEEYKEISGFCAASNIRFPSTQEPLPLPKKFPASLDVFLRLIVGGRQKAHRLVVFRRYLKFTIRNLQWPLFTEEELVNGQRPSLADIGTEIEKIRRRGFDNAEWKIEGWCFKAWRVAERSESARAKAIHAAKSRHKKTQ